MRVLIAASAQSTNTLSLVESLATDGNDIHVATLHPASIPCASVHALGSSDGGTGRLAYVKAIPAMRRLYHRIAPDVTIGYYASSYGLLASSVPRPRVVATAGGDVLRDAQDSGLRRLVIPLLARLAISRAQLVLCWAPHLASAAEALGARRDRILTLPRGIDTELFREADHPPSGIPTIITTRAIRDFYRPELLLEGFATARSRGLSARLLFVGEGPAEADLKARAARDALSGSVSFAGRLTPVELADRLRASRVYASFPKSEGVSASLLEAMATGLVPVVNALPANVEWVCDEENGLVVPNPPTVDDVATALRRAVEDVELAQRARTRNSTLVRSSASRSSNAHRFLAAFDELVRTSRGRET